MSMYYCLSTYKRVISHIVISFGNAAIMCNGILCISLVQVYLLNKEPPIKF